MREALRRHLVRVRRRRRDRPPEAVRRRTRGLAGPPRRRCAAGEDVRDRAARRASAGRGADRDLREPVARVHRGRGAGRRTRRSRPARRCRGAWSGWSAGCPPEIPRTVGSAPLLDFIRGEVEFDRARRARVARRVVRAAIPPRAAGRHLRRCLVAGGGRVRAAGRRAPRRGGVRARVAGGAAGDVHRRPHRAARGAGGAGRARDEAARPILSTPRGAPALPAGLRRVDQPQARDRRRDRGARRADAAHDDRHRRRDPAIVADRHRAAGADARRARGDRGAGSGRRATRRCCSGSRRRRRSTRRWIRGCGGSSRSRRSRSARARRRRRARLLLAGGEGPFAVDLHDASDEALILVVASVTPRKEMTAALRSCVSIYACERFQPSFRSRVTDGPVAGVRDRTDAQASPPPPAQLSAAARQNRAGETQPPPGYQQPPPGYQQPPHRATSSRSRRRATSSRRPDTSNRYSTPRISNRRPGISNRRRAISNRRPDTSRADISRRRPGISSNLHHRATTTSSPGRLLPAPPPGITRARLRGACPQARRRGRTASSPCRTSAFHTFSGDSGTYYQPGTHARRAARRPPEPELLAQRRDADRRPQLQGRAVDAAMGRLGVRLRHQPALPRAVPAGRRVPHRAQAQLLRAPDATFKDSFGIHDRPLDLARLVDRLQHWILLRGSAASCRWADCSATRRAIRPRVCYNDSSNCQSATTRPRTSSSFTFGALF